MQTGQLVKVDPDDDDIRRYVVRHYDFDPERHERRHRVVAAYDNRREFEETIKARSKELDSRRAADEFINPLEYYSGAVLEPGHKRRADAGRLLKRAIAHNVVLSDATLRGLELPGNVAVVIARKSVRVGGLRGLWSAIRARLS